MEPAAGTSTSAGLRAGAKPGQPWAPPCPAPPQDTPVALMALLGSLSPQTPLVLPHSQPRQQERLRHLQEALLGPHGPGADSMPPTSTATVAYTNFVPSGLFPGAFFFSG